MELETLLKNKTKYDKSFGFTPDELPDWLYPFQKHLVDWSLHLGRSGIFADCGLGKTAMQLAWADAIVKKENKPVLILTPLAVSQQTVLESEKFGVESSRCTDGNHGNGIIITNYERLHYFNPDSFCGVVCDESSILKNYSGATRTAIIKFMQSMKYRLLCSATPSPNDYTELGNSVEALGLMRRVEMLASYFVHDGGNTSKWRLKGHGKNPFWRFVASWARAIRKPSDIGFDDDGFDLPELIINDYVLPSKSKSNQLFASQAVTLQEQRAERKSTLNDRCEKVGEIANCNDDPFIAWCSLNAESKLLSKVIEGAEEITGSQSDEEKEEKILGFQSGQINRIVTKPSMAAFGLNWQHCNRMSFFPSHSHEQFYQAVRRCWRFGQKSDVDVSIVTTTAEISVLDNLMRKEKQSIRMFEMIVANMATFYDSKKSNYNPQQQIKVPSWLKS